MLTFDAPVLLLLLGGIIRLSSEDRRLARRQHGAQRADDRAIQRASSGAASSAGGQLWLRIEPSGPASRLISRRCGRLSELLSLGATSYTHEVGRAAASISKHNDPTV